MPPLPELPGQVKVKEHIEKTSKSERFLLLPFITYFYAELL